MRFAMPSLLALVLGTMSHATALAYDASGHLYGTVTTVAGTEYTGFLRWGTQEAFYDDLFHSLKVDLPYAELAADREERDRDERRGEVRVLKWRFRWDHSGSASRVFVARFGDIETIRVTGDEDAEIRMKSGEVYRVSGYADDVGGSINVQDESLGEIDLKWDRIESIAFRDVPRSAKPVARRLYGVVETERGTFEGHLMWDKEECTTSDLLDGESEDGDLSIDMGRIRSIERRGRSSSIVELADGRRLRLRGSNDVDDDNRGIMVEVPGVGKVTIGWEAFERVVFQDEKGSGRGYGDYDKASFLRARVAFSNREQIAGRIVYDLDEAETWEMLNGRQGELEFDIPFANIVSIRPIRGDGALVTLRNGSELELSDSQDVSEGHDGLLLWRDGEEDPEFRDWMDVESIEFKK